MRVVDIRIGILTLLCIFMVERGPQGQFVLHPFQGIVALFLFWFWITSLRWNGSVFSLVGIKEPLFSVN